MLSIFLDEFMPDVCLWKYFVLFHIFEHSERKKNTNK